jgi:hypothetical protein
MEMARRKRSAPAAVQTGADKSHTIDCSVVIPTTWGLITVWQAINGWQVNARSHGALGWQCATADTISKAFDQLNHRPIDMTPKLEPAFPSNPTRPTKYHVHVVDQSTNQRFSMGFYSLYAAHIWVEQFIREIDDKVKWRDEQTFICGTYLFKEEHLEKIIEYTPRSHESEWQMGDHEFAKILQFLGKGRARANDDNEPQEKQSAKLRVQSRGALTDNQAKRESKPKASKEGLVTVQMIAVALKIDPRDARAALRKLKIEKPDAGWAWPQAEAKKVQEQIKGAIK